MHGRKGFTLIELLIVMSTIAVLISLLLPVVWRFRHAAMATVCSSRVRDLTLASLAYMHDHRKLPRPPRNGAGLSSPLLKKSVGAISSLDAAPPIRPHQIARRLINDLHPYLKYPRVEESTSPAQLPIHVQSPLLEGQAHGRGPHLSGLKGNPYYNTGYSYVARLDEASMMPGRMSTFAPMGETLPVLLRPDRTALARPFKRAPIWCDTIAFQMLPAPTWHYTHDGGAGRTVPWAAAFEMPADCTGQHVGYSDGSVEWVPVKAGRLNPADLVSGDGTASYTITGSWYWWF